jgi:hypothetical protein
MKKVGYQGYWQNRRWLFYPQVKVESVQNYFCLKSRGYAVWYKSEVEETSELLYLSPMFSAGENRWRIGVLFARNRYGGNLTTAYTFIAETDETGALLSAGEGENTFFDDGICQGTKFKAYMLDRDTGYHWAKITANTLLLLKYGAYFIQPGNGLELFTFGKSQTWETDHSTQMCDFMSIASHVETSWRGAALSEELETPAQDVITSRMTAFSSGYAYWYGGQGEVATAALLETLAAKYPDWYTSDRIAKCNEDIAAGLNVADTSWSVCYAYNYEYTDTFYFSQMYITRDGNPENGDLMVRAQSENADVGIYSNGYVLEFSRSQLGYIRTAYKSGDWSRAAYDPNIFEDVT